MLRIKIAKNMNLFYTFTSHLESIEMTIELRNKIFF